MSGYVGGFFAAVKDSRIFARSTVYGAVTNIILNLILTPHMGALGAAIATSISYFEVWAFRYWHSKKYIRIKIDIARDLFSYILLVVQSSLLLLECQKLIIYIIEVFIFLILIILYLKDLVLLLSNRNITVFRKEKRID